MSRVFHDVKVGLDDDLDEKIGWLFPHYSSYRVLRKSVDARQRHNPHFVYSVEVYGPGEVPPLRDFTPPKANYKGATPLIVGAGPAGLFAALRFVERGVACHLFERGGDAHERIKGINRFWRYGELDPHNNVCFGEGGAGLYSDGKLITRVKSEHIPYVMNRLVKFGAPEEIEYLANPHVGSDRIRRVIPKIREFLRANGCTIHFNTQVTELLYEKVSSSSQNGTQYQVTGLRTEKGEVFHSDRIILATGHSALDVFEMLKRSNVHLDGKSFALGLRIEHPQKLINKIQYRDYAEHPKLGAANYKLAHHDKETDIGVYSFCMCPGGYVLSSGTEKDGVVCNGMSNYHRNSPFANAAVVVTIDHQKTFGDDIWGGLKLRTALEQRALQMVDGRKEIPAQKLSDFFAGRVGDTLPSSSPSKVLPAPLHDLLPPTIYHHLKKGIEKFADWMDGFYSEHAQLHAIESRTSCPLRVTRHALTLESLSHQGLYPCGEGAGYAGGITSAACDGIKIADKILETSL